jgi:hypothetical protein
MQRPAIWHSSLAFYLLTKFSSGGAINCNDEVDFSKLITRPMGVRMDRSETIFVQAIGCDFAPSVARQHRLTISGTGVRHTLNRQSLQGFSPRRGPDNSIILHQDVRVNQNT